MTLYSPEMVGHELYRSDNSLAKLSTNLEVKPKMIALEMIK